MNSRVSPEILREFAERVRYKTAPSWKKPWLDPRRFFANQMRRAGWTASPFGEVRVTRTFCLEEFHIVNGEAVSEQIGSYGVYEESLTEAFLRLVESDQTVADIGMHLGYYSTLFALLVGPKGSVHAFEPTVSTRGLAARNLAQFPQVTVHPYAMWSSDGRLSFRDYGIRWMAFNSFGAAKTKEAPPEPTITEVESMTLDSFRERLGRPLDLIKIDAESAEEAILSGGRKTLTKDRPLVSIEVGDDESEPASCRSVDLLSSMDYRPWEFRDGGFRPHQRRETYGYDNLIFAPADRDLSRR